jgi:hypothetical protein
MCFTTGAMSPRLAVAILLSVAFLPLPVQAQSKRKAGKQAEKAAAPAAGSYGMPSARLDPLLEPCLNAILSPLDGNPKMPRIDVEKLRASFAAGQIKAATQGQQQIFQNAMAVCDALTKSMDERANAKAAAQASSKVPMRSEAAGIIKSSPMRGVDAGANAEAIRKKQRDERKDADDVARRNVAFMNSAAARSWTERSPALRRSVMVLYTRQVQLEALEERNAAIAAQAAGSATAAEAAKAAKAAQDEAAARNAAAAQAAREAAGEKVARARAEALARAAAAKKAAKAAEAEAAAKAAAAEKAESAKLAAAKSLATEAAYVGEWNLANPKPGQEGRKTFVVNEDHTAIRKFGGGVETPGAWNIVDGVFRLHWEEGPELRGKLSEDGQRIESDKAALSWVRKKSPDGSNTAAVADAKPAKPAPQPAEAPTENPVSAPAAKTAKKEAANERRLVGSWTVGAGGNSTVEIKDDHTATKTRRGCDPTKGTWSVAEDGHFEMKWEDGGAFKAKLSDDGQKLDSITGEAYWSRKKP